MKPTPKEFALAQIAPYYKDPSICGYENGNCKYLTEDGRKCVLGKNLLYPENYSADRTAYSIFFDEEQEDVLIPEAVGVLSVHEWRSLQNLHDVIARKCQSDVQLAIKMLDLFTEEELIEYCKTH